jgi:hypothetical protein
MRSLLLAVLILVFSGSAFAQRTWVSGYYRSDGTYVRGHWRSVPSVFSPTNHYDVIISAMNLEFAARMELYRDWRVRKDAKLRHHYEVWTKRRAEKYEKRKVRYERLAAVTAAFVYTPDKEAENIVRCANATVDLDKLADTQYYLSRLLRDHPDSKYSPAAALALMAVKDERLRRGEEIEEPVNPMKVPLDISD